MQIARSRETFPNPISFLNTQHSYDKKYIELSESCSGLQKLMKNITKDSQRAKSLVEFGSERSWIDQTDR